MGIPGYYATAREERGSVEYPPPPGAGMEEEESSSDDEGFGISDSEDALKVLDTAYQEVLAALSAADKLRRKSR